MKVSRYIALAAFAAVASASADVPATIKLADGKVLKCELRWLPAQRADNVAVKASDGKIMDREVKPSDIADMRVAEPKDWKTAQNNPRRLQEIAQQYRMLQWDAEAGAALARGLLKQGKAPAAVAECQKIAQGNPRAAYDSTMAPEYWRALVEAGKTSELPKLLDQGVRSQNQYVAGSAALRRGDWLMSQDRVNDALKDGYLRCVFLFADQPAVRAEAAYKAAEAFEKARKPIFAEKMRKLLREKYPNSPWAKK